MKSVENNVEKQEANTKLDMDRDVNASLNIISFNRDINASVNILNRKSEYRRNLP